MHYKTKEIKSKYSKNSCKNNISVLDLILGINKAGKNRGSYRLKVINLGHVIKVYRYTKDVWMGFDNMGGRMGKATKEEKIENRIKVVGRIRNKIINYALANFKHTDKFVTLTFRDHITDIKVANKEFKKFIKRLRRYLKKDFRYIAVIEFTQKGRVHYHLMMDIEYIKKSELIRVWKCGDIVKINRMDKQNNGSGVDNVGAYLVKYMNKDVKDKRLIGNKAYLISRNIKKPEIIVGSRAEKFIKDKGIEKLQSVNKHVYERKGKNYDGGIVTYDEYNLKRAKLILN